MIFSIQRSSKTKIIFGAVYNNDDDDDDDDDDDNNNNKIIVLLCIVMEFSCGIPIFTSWNPHSTAEDHLRNTALE
jgi:hypothetical protein